MDEIEAGRGWIVLDIDGGPHIIPRGDLIEHEVSTECVCGPETIPLHCDDGTISYMYSHHSLDGREINEKKG